MTARVMFHVQHLLGIGHLKRASAIARAMTEDGLEVTMALGGPDVPEADFGNARLLRLPAARAADAAFSAILDDRGRPIDEAWKARRAELLMAAFRECRPRVLMFELFPFGRRQFAFEILPLLEAAAGDRCKVVSSVRDVLVRKPRPRRNREIVDVVRRWFDLVLVHGDPALIPFEDSFPEAAGIAGKLRYTGYVADRAPAASGGGEAGSGEVVVSVGGGAVGGPLLEAALAARPLSRLADVPWRLLAGPNLDDARLARLAAKAPPGITVERNRPDFPVLLANCALSISQGGYNTVIDILGAGARAVVVPFAEGGENEQGFRARRLQQRGLVRVLDAGRLSPPTLARAVDEAMESPPPPAAGGIDLSGAATTAAIVAGMAG